MMHGGGWHAVMHATDEKPKVTWALLRRVMTHARPYRWHIAGMLFVILLSTGLSLLTPLILRDLIDNTIPSGDIPRLIGLSLLLLLIPALNGGLMVIQRGLNARVGEGVIYDLRVALFDRLQRMSLRFFTNTKVGEMMSRLNNDVIGAQNAISNTIVGIVTNLIQAAAVLAVMLTLEWRLTLISVAIMPLFILAARRMGNRLRDIARRQMDANAQMNAMMNETLNIGGALLVKLFGRKDTEVERFQGRAANVRDLGIQRSLVGAVFFIIVGLISAVGTALVFGIGGYLAIIGSFSVGTIVAFSSYLGGLYASLQGLANAPVEFAISVVSFERVFEVIDLPQDIAEAPDALALQAVAGDLVFEAVTFRYQAGDQNLLSDVKRFGHMDDVTTVLSGQAKDAQPGPEASGQDGKLADRVEPSTADPALALPDGEELHHSQARLNALDNVSFHVQPGQLVALVGPSGAGKTTLTYLIPRLYDPTQGRILIDGHDLRSVTLDSLATQIGMVTQETYLFHDTMRTNLLYARLDASQAEIEAACQAANIHDFIAHLPDGYDTIVGERGYRLSGGEKQRLALARVILKDPRILVLDEATSHLDSESEVLIQEALKHVMAARTSIVIAHRLSTILAADLILVFDRGQVVERGTHRELLAQGGLYAQLYETQFSQERSA
ncbi:MAG: ABC transporter ATP-binding protein/permease [Anaerolineales bacterium]|jgi:ATP-binding cassette subfamily B protein|nr:ABC transporter ATP-binding protein/permease [Anaerolineales bacterium]